MEYKSREIGDKPVVTTQLLDIYFFGQNIPFLPKNF